MRALRSLDVVILGTLLGATVAACGGSSPASQLVQVPKYDHGGAKCSVAKSQTDPLVVDWSSVDRARLEALARSGVVPVKYSGCEMRVLANCSANDASYRYVGTTRKHDEDHIRNADELYAKLPLGAARLEGTLQRAGELSVAMTIVGRYQFDRTIRKAELQGDCAEATHVISALTVGAFAFEAGGSAKVGSEVTAFGAGGGAKSEASHDVLSQDGVASECEKAGADDARAPAGCGALIRLELRVLPETVAQVMQDETKKADEERRGDAARATAKQTRTWAYIAGGSGLGVLAAGVAFTLLASSSKTSIESGSLATSADIESAASRTSTFQGASYVSYAAGGALLLTGVALLVFGPPSDGPERPMASAPQGVIRW
jgi:hypothetical protein